MQGQDTSVAIAPRSDAPDPARLGGHWRRLARVVWGIVAALALLPEVAGLPVYFAQLQTVCTRPPCPPEQLTPDILRSLQQFGFSVTLYAAYFVALDVVLAVVGLAVAIIIMARKADDWMALLVALILVIGDIGNAPNVLVTVAPAWWLPVTCVNFFQPLSVCVICCLFPDGRFVPRWIVWIVPIWIAWNVPIFSFLLCALYQMAALLVSCAQVGHEIVLRRRVQQREQRRFAGKNACLTPYHAERHKDVQHALHQRNVDAGAR